MRGFEGGPEAFINLIYSGTIRDFTDLRDLISFSDKSGDPTLLSDLQIALGSPNPVTYKSIFAAFLEGTGLPCPQLFAEVMGGFSPMIELSDLSATDLPSFRSKIFAWASTGSPHLDSSLSQMISVGQMLCYR